MKIALSIIVGNEQAVIERFLESFAPAFDILSACIAAGNKEGDDTAEIITNFCIKNGKSLRLSFYFNKKAWPHVDDFAAARNLSWENSKEHGPDYILWADADDVLAPGAAEKIRARVEKEDFDVLVMPYRVRGSSQIVMRERLVRNMPGVRWQYPIHEQLAFDQDVKLSILDAEFIHAPLSTKSGSSERNVRILKAATEEASRNFFYLHQEAFENGRIDEAKPYAETAMKCPGLTDLEHYEILLNLAQVEQVPSVAKGLASRAFELMPDRREALALLISFALVQKKYEKAHALAKIMIAMPKPKRSYWSLNHDWYDWKGFFLYTTTLRMIGENAQADKLERENFEKHGALISVIHASLGRPTQALQARELWMSRASNPASVEYIFGLHSFDDKSDALKGFAHTITNEYGSAPNYQNAALSTKGFVIVQAQDDIVPPMHWDKLILERIGDIYKPAFLAVGDGHRTDKLCATSIMTRSYFEQKGNEFFHPGYKTVFCDTENTWRAYRDGVMIEARDLTFLHNHPVFDKRMQWDATYEIENAPENYQSGAKLFMERNPGATLDTATWA